MLDKSHNKIEKYIYGLSHRFVLIRLKSVLKFYSQTQDIRAFDSLVLLLKDKYKIVRRYSAFALGRLHDERAIPYLLNSMKFPIHEDDIIYSTTALAEIGGNAFNEFVKILSEENNNWELRVCAATDLSRFDEKSVEPLIKAFDDPEYKVRSSAVRSLGIIRKPQAIKPLKDLYFSEKHYHVRGATVWALSQFDNKEITDFLKIATKDKNKIVAKTGRYYLSKRTVE